MISLIYFLFRLVLLAGFTFLFVVLFEHGSSGFKDGLNVEWDKVSKFAASFQSKAESAPVTSSPASSPAAVAATPRPLSSPDEAPPAPEAEPSNTDSVAETVPSVSESVTEAAPAREYVPSQPPTVGATATPAPAATPRSVSSQAPSAWLELQKKEIGAPSSGTPRPKKNINTDEE